MCLVRVQKKCTTDAPTLRYGEILRDFPYFTENSTIQFFSTHPSLCENIFGYAHGQRIQLMNGTWSGYTATVCGTRAGRFYIVLDGETMTRELSIPTDIAGQALSYNVRDLLTQYHGMKSTEKDGCETPHHGHTERHATDRQNNYATQPHQSDIKKTPFDEDTMTRVRIEMMRTYTTEECAFLQRAPDLYITLVNEQSESEHATRNLHRHSTVVDAAGTVYQGITVNNTCTEVKSISPCEFREDIESYAEESCSTSSQTQSAANPGNPGKNGKEPFAGGMHVNNNTKADHNDNNPTQTQINYNTISSLQHRNTCTYNDIVTMPLKNKIVILAPHVIAGTKSIGWTGESPIVADAGGVHNFHASLSASFSL